MKHKFNITILLLLYSCSAPINITKLVDKYPNIDERVNNNDLIIYQSTDNIIDDYIVIAKIQLTNDIIYGNLMHDNRIKGLLLSRINKIGADAVIYNDIISDSVYTFFDAIHFISYDKND